MSEPEIPSLSEETRAQQPPISEPPKGTNPDDNFLARVRDLNEKRATTSEDLDDARQTVQQSRASQNEREEVEEQEVEEQEEVDIPDEEDSGEEKLIEDPLESSRSKRKTKGENLKNLREALKSERGKTAQLEEELQSLRSRVENITQSEEVQRLISEKEERIKELEKYEDLLGLYKTEGFKEAYYDSIEQTTQNAVAIAKDYDVDESVVKEALTISNRRELNDYLSQYFDPLGVSDIRKHILDAQAIAVERHRAEQNPRQAREQLIQIMNESRNQRAQKVRDKLKVRMKTGWDSMLAKYGDSDAGIGPLVEKPTDKQHTEVRSALLKRSETEFGKLMGALVQSGMGEIPDTAVKALAARFQLSEVSGYLATENASLKEEVAELRRELSRNTSYSRPLSKGSGNGKVTTQSKKLDSKDIAKHTMQIAMDKLASN